jgi:hypothetical protein
MRFVAPLLYLLTAFNFFFSPSEAEERKTEPTPQFAIGADNFEVYGYDTEIQMKAVAAWENKLPEVICRLAQETSVGDFLNETPSPENWSEKKWEDMMEAVYQEQANLALLNNLRQAYKIRVGREHSISDCN